MDYSLTPEQRQIREMVRELARERVAPRARELDESGEFGWDIVGVLRDAGLFQLAVPEAYGGVGSDLLTRLLVIEELAKVDAATALLPAVQELGLLPILLGGSEEQKKRFLPKIASGEHLIAFALTEPEAGSDAANLQLRARREGNRYVLSGRKVFCTNGGVADRVCVFARTGSPGPKGISAFVVERGTPGFRVGRVENKLGIRWSNTAELIFEDARVPAENRLGEEGEGFSLAMRTLDRTRPGVAAQALGIAEGAFELALAYARERRQFGQPIAAFQAIQFMLADMAMLIEAARHLTYHAGVMVEEEGKSGGRLIRANRYSAMAKCFAADAAMRVTTDAVQILGGYGFTREYPAERMMRDAKITQIYEGTNQIQRLVIARTFLEGDGRERGNWVYPK